MVETVEVINDQARWAILQRKIQGQRIARIFGLFRENDIEPLLIKGFAADQFYPPDVFRSSIDVDIAVSSEDYERASALAASTAAEGMAIDLHRELRHLDSLDWPDLFENSRMIDVEGSAIRVLRPEDHLRVLSVHWLNDGGVNREKLWDIYYLVTNRPANFDWQRALESVGAKRRRWIVCTILLAEEYLGLDISRTPLADESKQLPRWLTRSIENSWKAPPREVPLWLVTKQPSEFVRQIRLRLVPNPVRATIEMEGDIDASTRFFYRTGNFFQRLVPSLGRSFRSLEK